MKLANFGLKTRLLFTDFFDPNSNPDLNLNPDLISDPKHLFRFRIGSGSGQKFQILNTALVNCTRTGTTSKRRTLA